MLLVPCHVHILCCSIGVRISTFMVSVTDRKLGGRRRCPSRLRWGRERENCVRSADVVVEQIRIRERQVNRTYPKGTTARTHTHTYRESQSFCYFLQAKGIPSLTIHHNKQTISPAQEKPTLVYGFISLSLSLSLSQSINRTKMCCAHNHTHQHYKTQPRVEST